MCTVYNGSFPGLLSLINHFSFQILKSACQVCYIYIKTIFNIIIRHTCQEQTSYMLHAQRLYDLAGMVASLVYRVVSLAKRTICHVTPSVKYQLS